MCEDLDSRLIQDLYLGRCHKNVEFGNLVPVLTGLSSDPLLALPLLCMDEELTPAGCICQASVLAGF